MTSEPTPESTPIPSFSELSLFRAHRAWECRFEHDKNGRLFLRSTGMSMAWRSNEITATCDHCVEEPPNEGCSCGVYCMKTAKDIKARFMRESGWVTINWHRDKPSMYVFGIVILWGKIIEGSDGFRAQHAKMEYLILPPDNLLPKYVLGSESGQKRLLPVEIDLSIMSYELSMSYDVPVIRDEKLEYYWEIPNPELPQSTTTTRGGRKAGVPQFDTISGMVYKSKSAVGRAVAMEYNMDPNNHFVWYEIIKADPGRFRNATAAEIATHNKNNPWNRI